MFLCRKARGERKNQLRKRKKKTCRDERERASWSAWGVRKVNLRRSWATTRRRGVFPSGSGGGKSARIASGDKKTVSKKVDPREGGTEWSRNDGRPGEGADENNNGDITDGAGGRFYKKPRGEKAGSMKRPIELKRRARISVSQPAKKELNQTRKKWDKGQREEIRKARTRGRGEPLLPSVVEPGTMENLLHDTSGPEEGTHNVKKNSERKREGEHNFVIIRKTLLRKDMQLRKVDRRGFVLANLTKKTREPPRCTEEKFNKVGRAY